MRRPAPQRAGERVTKHFDQVRRLFGIRGAKTEAVQIKSRPPVLRKRSPVSIDLVEQGARGVSSVVRSRKQIEPTPEIGILQSNARDGAIVQIFDAALRRPAP